MMTTEGFDLVPLFFFLSLFRFSASLSVYLSLCLLVCTVVGGLTLTCTRVLV